MQWYLPVRNHTGMCVKNSHDPLCGFTMVSVFYYGQLASKSYLHHSFSADSVTSLQISLHGSGGKFTPLSVAKILLAAHTMTFSDTMGRAGLPGIPSCILLSQNLFISRLGEIHTTTPKWAFLSNFLRISLLKQTFGSNCLSLHTYLISCTVCSLNHNKLSESSIVWFCHAKGPVYMYIYIYSSRDRCLSQTSLKATTRYCLFQILLIGMGRGYKAHSQACCRRIDTVQWLPLVWCPSKSGDWEQASLGICPPKGWWGKKKYR